MAPLLDTLIDDARRIHRNLSERGLRAYVRHRLTNYESLLAQISRHEFQTELYPILRERVGAAVERWATGGRSPFISWKFRT
ncbi:hypothetical protein [Gemmata obscuriglobus]|uniref:Uncharacterized protein n=1 Tax=Gemmata obscuriglobus TaxID=114 RepID=A0A2Z3H1E7_9BACT|nr:hypothetical protein [Gemmata obscuriglobus]AWM39843.1 hypothetical protein C1280_24430 [Gemmata obscuriglobus]